MEFIGKYEEFAPGMGFPSMKMFLLDEPYPEKTAVLKYLNAGTVHMVIAARIKDVFTGKNTGRLVLHMNDGKYSWSSKLVYYIEQYNLRLPEELEIYILNR